MNKRLFVFSVLLLSSCTSNTSNSLSSLDDSIDSSFSSSSESSFSTKEESSDQSSISQSSLETLLSWKNATLTNMNKVTSGTDISFPIPNGFTNTYADLSYKDESNFVFKVQDIVDFDSSEEYFSTLLNLGFNLDVTSIESDKSENIHTLKYSFPGDYGLDSIDASFYYFDGIFSLQAKKVASGGYYQDESFPKDRCSILSEGFDSSLIPSFNASKEYSFYQSYFYTGYGCVYGYIDLEDRKEIINLYNEECKNMGYTVSKDDESGTYSANKDSISLNYYLGDDNVFYVMIYC